MSKRKGITRRDLLKGAAMGTALAAAGTTGLYRPLGMCALAWGKPPDPCP